MYTKTDHPLHYLLDLEYDLDKMKELLASGSDPNQKLGPFEETPLLVAVRRRRVEPIEPLLSVGADINAKNKDGKTAYAHAVRRGFTEISQLLEGLGADTALNKADELAVALVSNQLEKAKEIIAQHPDLIPNMTPEEARILPDLAGRNM